jgi:uncharacterized protein YutE (UPF0331/DUF86 family)
MKNDVILKKMDSLQRCLKRIEEKSPENWDTIEEDYDLQDILTINLERAVQLSVDIGLQIFVKINLKPPDTMAEVFTILEEQKALPPGLAGNLKKAVGFRNIAVHEYEEINWEIVKSICTNHVKDFYQFMKAILRYEP